jgi:hypothetical protein
VPSDVTVEATPYLVNYSKSPQLLLREVAIPGVARRSGFEWTVFQGGQHISGPLLPRPGSFQSTTASGPSKGKP